MQDDIPILRKYMAFQLANPATDLQIPKRSVIYNE
jgi:hypothetical protein